ncbi:MAG: hypothetical protein IPQ02_17445 [Saprospiraceae bacterium]|nr:hypothetical protein [Candidatus Defluviibacterium haderslevense]
MYRNRKPNINGRSKSSSYNYWGNKICAGTSSTFTANPSEEQHRLLIYGQRLRQHKVLM